MTDSVPWMRLQGTAFARGQQQAARQPGLAPQVRQAVNDRLASLAHALARPATQAWLRAQAELLQTQDPQGFEESTGIAEGFGIAHDALLTYLHGNIVADFAVPQPEADGCTAWAQALGQPGDGARVVKNRDYRGEHGRLQHVFLHNDPAWGGRRLLCLGSLGSPGAFSSGMNSDGLVVVDTQISTRDHGRGWLRYFLMTALLRECADVPAALAFIESVPHAGGGSLVLGDHQGRIASVELGHRQLPAIVRGKGWVAHTNHYLDSAHVPSFISIGDDLADSSTGRLALIEGALAAQPCALSTEQTQALMSRHEGMHGVCRHPVAGRAGTLSCVIYDTYRRELTVSHGPPCEGLWSRFGLDGPLGA